VPSWFFLAEQDRMIDPATQAFMAQRMGADIRSHPADHAPLITAPAAVAELIGEALAELQTRV
jgi:pimeloyl-ACP methyl ester carboxylesterase